MGRANTKQQNSGASVAVGNKRKRNFKQTVASPYSIEWNSLSVDDTDVLLARLGSESDIKKRCNKKEQSSKFEHPLICLGINEVTKALERNELSLVLCCRNIQPYIMIQHIPILCQLHQTPVCALAGKQTSFQLAKIFGLRTAIAIGFKKSNNGEFSSFFEFCMRKASPLNIPWLPAENEDIQYCKTTIEPREKKQRID